MRDSVGQTAPRRSPPAELADELALLGIEAGSYDFEPLDMTRRAIARRTTDAFRDVPHFPLTAKIEMDALIHLRARISASGAARISLNDMMIKAAALALIDVPAVNSSYTARGFIRHHRADISVAVAIAGGMVTPIVRAAETKSLAVVSAEMKDLAERARARRLQPSEYLGGFQSPTSACSASPVSARSSTPRREPSFLSVRRRSSMSSGATCLRSPPCSTRPSRAIIAS